MKIVGLGYKSRSGKDTLANMLVSKFRLAGIGDVRLVPFARKLKQVAHDLYGMYGLKDEAFYNEQANAHLRDVPLACGLTPVAIWIALGDTLKKATYEPMWRDYVFARNKCDVLIVPDVRYPAEAVAIKELGGEVYRVDRPSSVTKGSDRYLDDYAGWDGVIDNSGDLVQLDAQANLIVQHTTRKA